MTVQAVISHLQQLPPDALALRALEALVKELKPRRVARPTFDYAPKDTSEMSDAELRAYYKARETYDDADFLRRFSAFPAVREAAAALLRDVAMQGPTPENRKEVILLRQRSRGLWNAASIAEEQLRVRVTDPGDSVSAWKDGENGGIQIATFHRSAQAEQEGDGWHFYGVGQEL